MSQIGDALRQKLREVSKGEPNTWGFVAMFMEMISEAEKSVQPEVAEHIERIRLAWADYCDDLAFLPQADPKAEAVDKAIQTAMVVLGSRKPQKD